MGQWEIFKNYEGDNWYERNKQTLKPKQDLIYWLLDTYEVLKESSAVLEVGASNGYRLEHIRQRYGCKVVAVEPSKKAVEEGKRLYPNVEFYNITAEEMDFKEAFDLVIMNGVFCWIERTNLLKVCHLLDQALKNGGYLIIGDFQTPKPIKNPYHHLKEEVYTYKQGYKNIFLSTYSYLELANLCYNHDTKEFKNITLQNIFCVSLLRKEEVY